MTLPARLQTAESNALIATMTTAIVAVQESLKSGRYVQVRRGVIEDRRRFDPHGVADDYDWWVDEYLSPEGVGYRAIVELPPTPEEGQGYVWRYGIHDGPDRSQDFPTGWHRVSTVLGVA